MSRPLRIDYPNAWHHVMNRVRRGEPLFEDSADYQQFIDLLQETTDLFNVRVAAFCLMPGHYHLLLNTPDANLSRCMRHINGVYTQRYNVLHGCDGSLFRGRYKSILVEADQYLLQLVRYIHRNPLKAGIVEHLDQYGWSSHKGYISHDKKWNWLHKGFVLDMLTVHKAEQIRHYRQFVASDADDELLGVPEQPYLPAILGSEKFMAWIKELFFEQKNHKEVPASKGLAPDNETILGALERFYGQNPEALTAVRRGRVNEPRDIAVYLIRTLRAEPLESIGAVFNLNRYSSVSSVIYRVKSRMQKDVKFRKRVEEIKNSLLLYIERSNEDLTLPL
ncbi:MAG: transposase [Desulfatiglandaceae bacterium]